jgi:hypothetical protein
MITLPPQLHDMAQRRRWLLWRREVDEDGKRRKQPYDLNQIKGLGSKDKERKKPLKLGTFSEAAVKWQEAPSAWSGLGFAPHIDDLYICIDFDDLSHPYWAILQTRTYCETSPSGNGGHALVMLRPEAKQRLLGIRNIKGFELYSDNGYFTVTGNAVNALPIQYPGSISDELVAVADYWNLQPKSADTTPVPTLTGRVVTPIEKGRVLEKIGRWRNAAQFKDMHDNWAAASTWAPRGKSDQRKGEPDRSWLMYWFVKYLVVAGARDPDLIWAIVKDSAVWREYANTKNAWNRLWGDIVKSVLREVVPPTPTVGNATPTHERESSGFALTFDATKHPRECTNEPDPV